ncbi:MAG: YceI family protein [Planctomycetia bacterium]|nr:YceI family protein [Planctomycetia bacterium]
MVRILMAFALLVAFTFTASAADTKYTLTGDNAKITFVGSKPDGKHEGGFKKLTGTATVTDGTLSKIEVEIDTDSLYSDDEKLTRHLKSPDFFGTKDNPKATFKTTKIEKADKGYKITGDLTMLGKTKSVSFPATVTAGETFGLTAEFKIDRTQWGMVYGKGKINDEVALKLNVSAKK